MNQHELIMKVWWERWNKLKNVAFLLELFRLGFSFRLTSKYAVDTDILLSASLHLNCNIYTLSILKKVLASLECMLTLAVKNECEFSCLGSSTASSSSLSASMLIHGRHSSIDLRQASYVENKGKKQQPCCEKLGWKSWVYCKPIST